MKALLAAAAVAALIASPVYARAYLEIPQSHSITGHGVPGPAWNFGCMTDHGPSPCGEPVWVDR